MAMICSTLLINSADKSSEKYTIWHYSRGKILSVKEYKENVFVYYVNDKYCDQEFRSEIYCFKTFGQDFPDHRELKYLGTVIRATESELHFFTNNTN